MENGAQAPLDDLIAFIGARLDEDERAIDTRDHDSGQCDYLRGVHYDPERAQREVATWRRVLLEYSIPPGTDAKYGGTERETGFRLALSFTLKAKAAEWKEHPDYPPDGNW
jgi:hypothetical protein